MNIGNYHISNNLVLAPMAGVSDRPFREICKNFGAGLTVSEMVSSSPLLRQNKRTLLKTDFCGESGLRWVQIVGTEPSIMADAARYNVDNGADIIDINMGCPAKKVCARSAGSALLKDELLVKRILESVVEAVNVPVTLKMRTGWDSANRNAPAIATIAENSGIAALTVHGRTRACKYDTGAEYETITTVKQTVKIPVIANGDIDCPQKAGYVLETTGADALMIGRAAQGNPWIFRQISQFLSSNQNPEKPRIKEIQHTLLEHLEAIYNFYGSSCGVRIARKHIAWYFKHCEFLDPDVKTNINKTLIPAKQIELVICAFNF
jgi:tRNA-dihydrouridine synthase B